MDPSSYHPIFLHIFLQLSAGIINPSFYLSVGFIVEIIVLTGLLFASGFISGAETAYFSITPAQLQHLKNSKTTASKLVYQLLNRPKRLLATLLITVNLANIGVVVLSSVIISQLFVFTGHETAGFIIQVVAVTFIIIVFCEVLPKVYATQNALRTTHQSAITIFILDKILRPLSTLLVISTSFVDKRMNQKGYDVTVDELTHAIDITSKNTPDDEKKILKGIAKFGNIDVRQIMKPRMDVIAIDQSMKFPELFPVILEQRYSRIPVYDKSFDRIVGLLYIKDLLPSLDQQSEENFNWQALLRPAYFVPESKKINDLLQEFQEKKIHLAIVVDEYGGSAGIVTLEDILEEIVGEINDEFDEEELFYSKLDDFNCVFEGKALLNDISRVMEVDRKIFEIDGNKEVDTLAGLILELKGSIPYKFETIRFNDILFTIESADRRRIKRVKITLPEKKAETPHAPESSGNSGSSAVIGLVILFSSLALSSCDEPIAPKPRGYFRIALPEKEYHVFAPADCPFTFEIPVYSQIVLDIDAHAEPCWMDLRFPQLKGTLYISYKEIKNNLRQYLEDSRTLALKHIPKASGIDEQMISNPGANVYGTRYNVNGNAASPIQFFITDSTRHFLRASLYFYTTPNPDSIAPVLNFISKDIDHLLETFRWK